MSVLHSIGNQAAAQLTKIASHICSQKSVSLINRYEQYVHKSVHVCIICSNTFQLI